MKKNHRNRRGFTLIELLVVIAIIAILSIVVILTLNPAELLKQARDSNRISDMSTIKSAISLFLADGNGTSTTSLGTATKCYMYAPGSSTCTWFGTAATYTTSTSRAVNGAGWIPVNFSAISSGAPLGQEPIDPTNNVNLFYSYISTSTNYGFKLAAKIESSKYSASGTSDVVSTDGGTDPFTYEQGSNLSL